MIVEAIKGDIIKLFKEGDYHAIAHGCNCFCRMGSGVAVDMKNAFPEALRVDEATIPGDRNKLGTFTRANYPQGLVINAYTQFTYWNPSDMFSYEALAKVMKSINCLLKDYDRQGIGDDHKRKLIIPCIGAGLARGEWSRIVKIINDNTPDINITVVVWDKERDQKLLDWYKNFKV